MYIYSCQNVFHVVMRTDHPTNTKRSGICLYCKDYLPIIQRDDVPNMEA